MDAQDACSNRCCYSAYTTSYWQFRFCCNTKLTLVLWRNHKADVGMSLFEQAAIVKSLASETISNTVVVGPPEPAPDPEPILYR